MLKYRSCRQSSKVSHSYVFPIATNTMNTRRKLSRGLVHEAAIPTNMHSVLRAPSWEGRVRLSEEITEAGTRGDTEKEWGWIHSGGSKNHIFMSAKMNDLIILQTGGINKQQTLPLLFQHLLNWSRLLSDSKRKEKANILWPILALKPHEYRTYRGGIVGLWTSLPYNLSLFFTVPSQDGPYTRRSTDRASGYQRRSRTFRRFCPLTLWAAEVGRGR